MPIYKPENCTFYVYAWLRAKDSRNGQAGSPYYVGKGKGARAKQKHVSRNWVAPLEDQIQILSANMNEVDAFQLEMFLIYLYGRALIWAPAVYIIELPAARVPQIS